MLCLVWLKVVTFGWIILVKVDIVKINKIYFIESRFFEAKVT
jgi:hypothetical protein